MRQTVQQRRKEVLALSVIAVAGFIAFAGAHSGTHFVKADDSYGPDQFLNTTPSQNEGLSPYPVAAVFHGDTVWVNATGNGLGNTAINITNATGSLVDRRTGPGKPSLSTSNASGSGRYAVWNETLGQFDNRGHSHVDLLTPVNDVTTRIGASNSGTPTITLRYWKNLSTVDATTMRTNISSPADWPMTGGSETIGRINTTLSKYWLGVKFDGYGWTYHASRGIAASGPSGTIPAVSTPRVNDFQQLNTAANVTGRLLYEDAPATGIEIRVYGRDQCPRCMARMPYMNTPPVVSDVTNSTGHFSLTGLDAGGSQTAGYVIDIVNESHARTSGIFFDPAFLLNGSSRDIGDVAVSNTVGHVNGTIDGDTGKTYALAAFHAERDLAFMEPQEDITNISLESIPNGTYSVLVAEFGGATGGPSATVSKTLTIKNGTTHTLHFTFPETVNITGNVSTPPPNGVPMGGITVTAENESRFKFYNTRTAADGSYTLQVENDTSYRVTARPPFGSDRRANTTTVTVNTSVTAQDLTLSKGDTLRGEVTAAGNPVANAEVLIWRESNTGPGSFHRTTTNQSGMYRITGLSAGTTYDFDVYPRDPSVGENHSTFTLGASQEWRNVSLTASTASIHGFVTDNQSNGLDATVSLTNYGNGTRLTTTTNSSGGYTFVDQPQHQYYELRVVPDDTGYSTDQESFVLYEDSRYNFTLAQASGLSGYVKADGSGLKEAEVFAYNFTTNNYGWTRTDTAGFYQIDLKPGNYTVSARKQGYPVNRTTATVTAGGATKNITLATGNTLSGYIIENGLITEYNGTIGVWNRSREAYGYGEITSGEYNLTGLRDVSYNVWIDIDKEGYTPKRKTLSSIPGSGRKNFSVGQNNGQKLNVTVTDDSGNDLANATVSTDVRQKQTNTNGFVTFPEQPIGTVSLNVNRDGYRGVRRAVNISKPNSNMGVGNYSTVDVSLTQVTEIDVDVNVTRNGKTVSSASVVFASNASDISESASAVTGGNGRATVDGLVAGDYFVAVSVDERAASNSTSLNVTKGWQHTQVSGDNREYRLWFDAER